MSMNVGALAGFLTLFVLYQIAEANGLDMLHIPRKPLSTFLLFIGVIVAAAVVAYAQGANGLAAYGLDAGGWWYYPLGVLLGVAVQGVMEGLGLALGIRKVSDFRLSLPRLAGGFLFILFANFPAAAARCSSSQPCRTFALGDTSLSDTTPPHAFTASVSFFGTAWACPDGLIGLSQTTRTREVGLGSSA